nr:hypothetical protein [Tropheryma whipplei]
MPNINPNIAIGIDIKNPTVTIKICTIQPSVIPKSFELRSSARKAIGTTTAIKIPEGNLSNGIVNKKTPARINATSSKERTTLATFVLR